MADRPSRRRSRTVTIPVTQTSTHSDNSRYDMSLPQNWSVKQLKTVLQQNNVLVSGSVKKSRLIQLCKDHGLLDQRVSMPQDNLIAETSQDKAETMNQSTVTELTKAVVELQRTVRDLTDNVSQLKGSPQTVTVSSSQSSAVANSQNSAVGSQSMISDVPGLSLHSSVLSSTIHDAESTGYVKTRYGYSAESLPFVETVHPSMRKQILEGKDINLAALLIPYYTGPHADPAVVTKEKPDPRLNQDLTLPQFIQAFGIYKNIMCSAYPNRRAELDLYERDIVDMATRYPGKGFYEYHKMFSAQAAAHLSYSNIKIDWSVRNKMLFCNIFTNSKANMCYLCQSSLHIASFCPKLAEKGFLGRNRSTSVPNVGQSTVDKWGRIRVVNNGKEVCNNFNAVRGCQRPRCDYLHVCLSCNKEHPQHECKESKNYKGQKDCKQK